MIKIVTIKDSNYQEESTHIVDTELDDNVDIIKNIIDIDSNVKWCKDFTEESYFNQVEWKWKHYTVEDAEIIKL